MIEVINWAGRTEYVNPAAIVRVEECSAQNQYNGCYSVIHFYDGKLVECKTAAKEIVDLMAKEKEKNP